MKYRIGDRIKLSETLTVQVLKVDSFGGIAHYGVLHELFPIDQPRTTFHGWMAVNALDNMNGVKL